VDAVLRAISDPTRRGILALTRDHERSAGEIAAHFPTISRPAVSQHLRVLAHAGLLDSRKAGNHRFYRTRPAGFEEARSFLESMWATGLDGLKRTAEEEAGQA
jgi:DNA-binding transcriptional ArsR family regulator